MSKILFACRNFNNMAGGIERMASIIMNEMVRRGHKVILLTWDPINSNSYYELNPEIIWHSVWDLNLKRVRGGWPHRCRVRWQTNDKKFQPLESTDVNLTMPKQIAPVDQRSKCTFGK